MSPPCISISFIIGSNHVILNDKLAVIMRWHIVGTGLLGTELAQYLRAHREDVCVYTSSRVDITCASSLESVNVSAGDVIVNCAAYTKVDDAENNRDLAFAVNRDGARNLARYARVRGTQFIHISTDYVFSSDDVTVSFSEDDIPHPLNVYGWSKYEGESAVLDEYPQAKVIRTAWLYGEYGGCFPRVIYKKIQENKPFYVVDDEYGQPTWAKDVAVYIKKLACTDLCEGIYHVTSAGRASWYEFACYIAETAGVPRETYRQNIKPISAREFGRQALRPHVSVLDHARLQSVGIEAIGHWRQRWGAASSTVLK